VTARPSIRRAVQLVLDDVGWREGWPLNDTGGPFRAGIGGTGVPCSQFNLGEWPTTRPAYSRQAKIEV
jgi:hypothetical protein